MNIRQVEVFKAIMDCHSITEAAKRLYITQPSVSKHLKLLEYNLGFQLFVRSGNRLIATREGHALYDQIERVYTGLDQLSNFVEDLKKNRYGEITIACMPLLSHYWLPAALSEFILDNDEVSISLPVRSSKWISQTIAARKADFGLAMCNDEPPPGVITEHFMSLPIVCVMRADHPLAQHSGKIEITDLEAQDVISLKNFDQWQLSLEKMLDERAVKPKRTIDTFSSQVACELVKNEVGIALVDVLSAADHLNSGLVIKPFAVDICFDIYLMQSEHWPIPQLATALKNNLLAKAQKTCEQMQSLIN